MNKKAITTMIVVGVVIIPTLTANAEMATMEEALTVADNWILRVTYNKGDWGGSEWAQVADIQELKRSSSAIGYYCRVEPQGFVLVSLHKELAPIKAFSERTNLDPESDQGMADLLKLKMEGILEKFEKRRQLFEVNSNLQSHFGIDYRHSWKELSGEAHVVSNSLQSNQLFSNYVAGQPLLSSTWHRWSPYNQKCPEAKGGCTGSNCEVGCVPLAGAQIVRYWAWPPNKTIDYNYDWLYMPNSIDANSPQNQIDAVATLCHDVGVYCEAEYCDDACVTIASTSDLLSAFRDFLRYNASNIQNRFLYDENQWFDLIKSELNANRPIPYAVEDHMAVCDGWTESGSTPDRLYHMNYGEFESWYALDALVWGNKDKEKIIPGVYPWGGIGATWGDRIWYPKPVTGYRYFDQDASGGELYFAAGHKLQFLPGVSVTRNATAGGPIRFVSGTVEKTRLFSIKGTATGGVAAKIRINSGGMIIHRNGSIRFH